MKKKVILITLLIGVVIIIVISITFFIFTTTMSQPTAMKLLQPKANTAAVDSTSKAAVSLLLFNDNNIYAYRGTEYSNGKLYKTDSTLREYLLQIKNEVNDSSFIVLIKPSKNSTYKNTVDVLDEMTINNIKRYVMIDIFEKEQKIIDSISKGK